MLASRENLHTKGGNKMSRHASLVALLSVVLTLSILTSAFAGITMIPGQGIILTGADGIILTGADGIILTGADGIILTGADGIILTGADALTYTGPAAPLPTAVGTGLRSFDPELAFILNTLPDTSAVNVFVAFHDMPTQSDFDALQSVGVIGGTTFRELPMVLINALKSQIEAISSMPSVRSIYWNKTISFLTHDTRTITRQSLVLADQTLTQRNGGAPLSGNGVTVAVLDTGIDATHPDLAYGTQVVQNVKVLDLQGTPSGFLYPTVVEGIANTDLVMGHGTFVAGVIAGTGAASGNYFGGMAPGARLLGISAGEASLFWAISGIDYILSNRVSQNIRVVNCSFGIDGVFDANDPINIATRIMHDAGITVVFSVGNRGDQPTSLNPYSVADWVIGVGSVTKQGSLSSFSSRGAAGYAMYHPTLVAPGENVVSTRASGVTLVGTVGLAGSLITEANDLQNVPAAYLPRYTTSSGTSFAAPHVAGAVALMLEANPALTPDEIKVILQETATPMLGYSRYEVGAGQLNTHGAVRKAAFGSPLGQFRHNLSDACTLSRDPLLSFSGSLAPGEDYTLILNVPEDTISVCVQVGWTGSSAISNPLTVTLSQASSSVSSKPGLLLAGPEFQKSGVTVNDPAPGAWTVSIANTGLPLVGGTQTFIGAIELFRAAYSVTGFEGLTSVKQAAVKKALRRGLITAPSGSISAGSPATRLEVARALMLAANTRVPQYLPDIPTFSDVSGVDAVFVESTVYSPGGNLMEATGSSFSPQSPADRLTVAVAIVRALGLEQLAATSGLINPGVADWYQIPVSKRGYVAVALSRNLMKTTGSGYFHPFYAIEYGDLAETAVALQQASR